MILKSAFIFYVEVFFLILLPASSTREFGELARILREKLQDIYNYTKFSAPDDNSHPRFSSIKGKDSHTEETLATGLLDNDAKRDMEKVSTNQLNVNIADVTTRGFVDSITVIQTISEVSNNSHSKEASPRAISLDTTSRSASSITVESTDNLTESQAAYTLKNNVTSRYSREDTDTIDDYDYNSDEISITTQISIRDSEERDLDDPDDFVLDDDVSDENAESSSDEVSITETVSQADESRKRDIDDSDSSDTEIITDDDENDGEYYSTAPEKRDIDGEKVISEDALSESEDTTIENRTVSNDIENKDNITRNVNTESFDLDAAIDEEDANSQEASSLSSTAIDKIETDESSVSETTWKQQTNSNENIEYSTIPFTRLEVESSLKYENISDGVDDWDEDKLYNLLEKVIPELLTKFIEIKPEIFNKSDEDSLTNALLAILPELIGNIVTDRPEYFLKTKSSESNKSI